MRTLNLNTVALATFGEAPKIRVKSKDGVLFIRPTDRKSAVNLPKAESLVTLTRTKTAGRFEVNVDVPVGASFGLATDKYGWFALVGEPARGAAAVKVA